MHETDELVASSVSDEQERIADWRLQQFRLLGFGDTKASLLADTQHVDLGRVRELVKAGCAFDTILRIVL